jgi:hypothetical protein
MKRLPYIAHGRIWTWRITPEGFFLLTIAIYVLGTRTKGWSTYVIIGTMAILAAGLPMWLSSRTLEALLNGIRYMPFFGISKYHAYSQISDLRIEGRTTTSAGGFATSYTLHIVGSSGHEIKIAMDSYRMDDVQDIA